MSDEVDATPASTTGGRSPPRLPAGPPRYPVLPPPPTQPHPVQHHASDHLQSPSTAAASPPVFSPPSTHGGHVDTPTLQPQPAFSDRGRAQIACSRCRFQKIKCKLEPYQTRCNRCIKKDEVCDFRTPAGSTPRLPKVRGSTDLDKDPRAAKRSKRLAPQGFPHGFPQGFPHAHISIHESDPLASSDFTPEVWEQLFDIYEQHFASDFPFLHRTRFLRPIHQHLANTSSATACSSSALPRPPHTKELLLGFLTMTGRYHDGLTTKLGSPKQTAEYFANLTQKALFTQAPIAGSDPARNDFVPTLPVPSLERAQTLLFLGFHRWADRKGQTGWQFLGQAWRMIQHLGYERDQPLGHEKDRKRPTRPNSSHGPDPAPEEVFITREIERRTFWSCFILDRYIGCSRTRPQTINVADTKIQLPCSDDAFMQGVKVRTRFIYEDDNKYTARRKREAEEAERRRASKGHCRDDNSAGMDDGVDWEVGKHESQLSVYIRAVDHFGEIMRWSVNSGRRLEGKTPPWDARTQVYHLIKKHEAFQSELPKHMTLTPDNTAACIINKKIRHYLSVHAIFSLCTIALHREYLALLPWGQEEPTGPLDEPLIDEPPPDDQPDYWIKYARKCFHAAKDFADLLRTCESREAMSESPIVIWTTYIVAWCVLYCHFFPNMDPDRVLASEIGFTLWRSLCNMLSKHIYSRYAMAGQYANFLTIVHRLFKEKRAEYRKAEGASGDTPESTTSDGGLEAYVLLGIEVMHKHMGAHDDETFIGEVPEADLRLGSESDIETRRSETTSPTGVFKTDETPASTPASTGFNSVNNNWTPQGGVRSESQILFSARDLARGSEAPANGASLNPSPSHNAAHDRDDRWTTRSPTIGTAVVTGTPVTAWNACGSGPLSSLHQHSRPEYSQANATGCHDSAPQMHYTHTRTPTCHPAYLAQLRRQGAVSVQNDDLLALKDSESGDLDSQDIEDTYAGWFIWDHQFGQNADGFDGSVTLDQQCLNLERYGRSHV